MSKHRRPTPLQRLGHLAGHSPLQLGIAAGVVGTLSVTGTVVASAADSGTAGAAAHGIGKANPVAATSARSGDLLSPAAQLALHDALEAAHDRRQAQLAAAVERARVKAAKAKRLAAHKQAVAAKHAAAKRAAKEAAAKRAASARTFSSASRGTERMSASAVNALELAASAASGAYYVHGGDGPNSFDCSGFTMYVFNQMGISLPHSSAAQRGVVQRVSNPEPGDLVFVYNGGGGSIGHVAIYAGGGYWWEAANPSTGVGKHRAWSSAVSYGRVL